MRAAVYRLIAIAVLLTTALSYPGASAGAAAQAGDLRIVWDESQTLTPIDYGGLRLPMRIFVLQTTVASAPRLDRVAATSWNGPIRRAVNAPPAAAQALPVEPVVVLAQGIQRGQRIMVLGISPLFSSNGVTMRASQVEARVPNATLLDAPASMLAPGTAAISAPPVSLIVTQPAVKVTVAQAGMQQVSGAGMPAYAANAARLWRNGVEVPIEVFDTDNNGTLGPSDTLRFYAPTPGDRWNVTDTYWLTASGEGSPRRISSRTLSPGTGATQTAAIERGVWRAPKVYDSRVAGPDSDRWFAASFASFKEFTTTVRLDITIASRLPRIAGEASYTITGAVSKKSGVNDHALDVSTGIASARLTWSGGGNWARNARLQQNGPQLTISSVNGPGFDELLLDQVLWELPASLDFQQRGATFVTPAAGRYQLLNPPARIEVYDITNPAAPARTKLSDSAGATFQSEAGREYLVLGEGTMYQPNLQPYTPPDLAAALNAQAIYIAPAEMHAALEPLVALRKTQVERVAVVDLQAIYDTWSFGKVDPEAIRSFLRSAYVRGNGALVAATLVGDGTNDPFDYSRKPGDEAANNINIIPPYLAPVDPWIDETACETCYAQLDGDNPLADTLPDIMIGRLPVKNSAQLAEVVAKHVRYETGRFDPGGASRMIFLTDNYNMEDGTTDAAGNFPAYAEQDIARTPPNMRVERLYYDPTAPNGDPTRERDARRAYERTRTLLKLGAAVVNYIGHGYYFQWASTNLDANPSDPNKGPGYLLSLYDPDSLNNANQLPIVLSMTCLTSGFQMPNFPSTSIDERLMLNPKGGAIATWGSSGEGVVFGHESLQRGFYTKLWATPARQATLGELTQAGYVELLTSQPIAQASLRTFLLLGDPLTRAQVQPARQTFLPTVGR